MFYLFGLLSKQVITILTNAVARYPEYL